MMVIRTFLEAKFWEVCSLRLYANNRENMNSSYKMGNYTKTCRTKNAVTVRKKLKLMMYAQAQCNEEKTMRERRNDELI